MGRKGYTPRADHQEAAGRIVDPGDLLQPMGSQGVSGVLAEGVQSSAASKLAGISTTRAGGRGISTSGASPLTLNVALKGKKPAQDSHCR